MGFLDSVGNSTSAFTTNRDTTNLNLSWLPKQDGQNTWEVLTPLVVML